jgi:glucoamylase
MRVGRSVCVLAAAGTLAGAGPAAAAPAPGAPGEAATWTTGAKQGVGTATTTDSKVWFTLAQGALTEVFYPRADRAQVRDLQLVVTDGLTFAERETVATEHQVVLADPRALVYRQVNTAFSGRYRVVKTTVADPARAALLVHVDVESLDGGSYRAVVRYDPSIGNGGMGDVGSAADGALRASEGGTHSALESTPPFARTSVGYAGTSEGLDGGYTDAPTPGNVVLTGETPSSSFTLALGFGATADAASAEEQAALRAGFDTVAAEYAAGWHGYLDSLPAAPVPAGLRTQYDVAVMALKAHEDKRFRGAGVASLTVPWGDARSANAADTGGYHLVWARDLYQVATAQFAAGDREAATRALDYLLQVQQRRDGSFPQNSTLEGTEVFRSLQLDEVAFPLILAWQLGRADRATWRRLKRSADFLVNVGPSTPQERWEEAEGYSPATIAAEVAGLVCAADLARRNGDATSATLYLGVADEWAREVDRWTFTTTGPLGNGRYYERIDRNGKPNDAATLAIANGGGTFQERAVVDPSFLELVRLGVKAPTDASVVESLPEVDAQTRVETPNGPFWHRYDHDGYGESAAGEPYTGAGVGRLWPLLTGERGEYELAAGRDAAPYLRAMAAAATDGYLIPEQVWDRPDGGPQRFAFGEGTGSATPLAWSLAQFVRLAQGIAAGKPVERPQVVVDRYRVNRGLGATLVVRSPRARTTIRGRTVVVSGTTNGTAVVVRGPAGTFRARVSRGRFSTVVRLLQGDNPLLVVAQRGREGPTALRALLVFK